MKKLYCLLLGDPMQPKGFVLLCCGIFVFLCGVFGFLLYYLSLIFEHNSFSEIVLRQKEKDSIYGTSLNENIFGYKLALINQHKPDIIALGGSRVLQFRQEYFNAPFINAGNAMNNLLEGEAFLKAMLATHKPKLVILGVTLWHFNEAFPNLASLPYHKINGTNITSQKLLTIAKMTLLGELFYPRYLFDNSFIPSPYLTLDSLGLNAINNSRGFLPDGSYVYGDVFQNKPAHDAHFIDTLQRIEQGNGRFEYATTFDTTRVQDFLRILALLKTNDIDVVLFVPPVAPSIYAAMHTKGDKYRYIDKLFLEFDRLGLKVFNYHNPAVLNNDDCEFLDGFHGGDTFYARILHDMASNEPILAHYVKDDILQEIITKSSGKAFAKTSIAPYPEQDFLQLGCKK